MQKWSEADVLPWIRNRDLWDRAHELMPSRLVHRFRSNLARFEILHRVGGVYIDCDFEALGPLEPHLLGVECFSVEERLGLLAIGIMGAVKGHPLFDKVIEDMPASVARRPGQPSWKANGQQHLQRTAETYGGLELLPIESFYPYHHRSFDADGSHPPIPDGAVAHHVWSSRRKSVSVIVPWRDPDEHRLRSWKWVRKHFDPSWQVVEASDGTDAPFNRPLAIQRGVADSFGDVIVVSDGDLWSDGLPQAIDAVRRGASWAVPHTKVYRFNLAATRKILRGADPYEVARDSANFDEQPYRGQETGGLVVMARKIIETVPPDARFVGWGGDDNAWGAAMNTLVGPSVRMPDPLWHLWHPPQPRICRSYGSEESLALVKTYQAASRNRLRMRRLVAQGAVI